MPCKPCLIKAWNHGAKTGAEEQRNGKGTTDETRKRIDAGRRARASFAVVGRWRSVRLPDCRSFDRPLERRVGDGAIDPVSNALHLEAKGLVVSNNNTGPNGRQRRYYRLTPAGLTRLEQDRAQWTALVQGLQALGLAPSKFGLAWG